MTYAVVMVKGTPDKRETTRALFEKLATDTDFEKGFGTKVDKWFVSFGWPDFVLILEANNVELIKHSIVEIRNRAATAGDNIETSTLICMEQKQIDKKREEWTKKG